MKILQINATTIADGTGSGTHTASVCGYLHAIEWIDGTFDDGVDATISAINPASGVEKTVAVLTNANDDAVYYPRALVHGVADGAALTGTAGGDRTPPLICGTPKLTIASGGDTKTGGCILYICEM